MTFVEVVLTCVFVYAVCFSVAIELVYRLGERKGRR